MWCFEQQHTCMLKTGKQPIWNNDKQKKSKRHVICDLLRVSSNVNAVANDEQPSENNINVA